MRVLLANKFFYRNGGSETVMFQEREFLLSRGYDVVDFSMCDSRNEDSPYSGFFVDAVDYNAPGLRGRLKSAIPFVHSREAVEKIVRLVDKTRPDVAHLHNIYHQLTPSIIPALRKCGVKVVLTLHDTKLVCPNYLSLCGDSVCDACGGRRFYKAFSRNCQRSRMKSFLLAFEAYYHRVLHSYGGVNQFIAPSRFLADKIVAGRPELGPVAVLRNGIDTELIRPSAHDAGYLLYFGRLSKEKGVETLISAYRSMPRRPPLKVVGTGPLLEALRADHADIDFTGYKSGEELDALISNAACVVVPSEWYENCSMVVLEAMAYGKPVIGSRIGGIPEQVEDGVTGYLFTMGDKAELASAMQRIMADSGTRMAMGASARRKLEREYSLEAHNQGLLQIYQQVTQSNS